MVITLIGYRASGKSSLAPMVAKKLGWSWIDSDRKIERVAGRSIPEIFAADGEAGFRELESQVLADLLQQPQLVIASGGGSVLSADNRQLMKAAGPVVWLHVSAGILINRLNRDRKTGSVRPSLTGRPIDEEVGEVLRQREPLYRDAASLIIHTDGESRGTLARRIVNSLQDRIPTAHPGEPE